MITKNGGHLYTDMGEQAALPAKRPPSEPALLTFHKLPPSMRFNSRRNTHDHTTTTVRRGVAIPADAPGRRGVGILADATGPCGQRNVATRTEPHSVRVSAECARNSRLYEVNKQSPQRMQKSAKCRSIRKNTGKNPRTCV